MKFADLGRVVGASAYELAVQQGYEGTLAEWLEGLKYDHSDEYKQLTEIISKAKEEIEKGGTEISEGLKAIKETIETFDSGIAEEKEAAIEAIENAITAETDNFTTYVVTQKALANQSIDNHVYDKKTEIDTYTESKHDDLDDYTNNLKDSLPADYTKLNDDLSTLSESITDIQNELKQDYAELRELVAEISDNEFYAFSSGFINTGGATTDYTVSQNANYVHTVVDCQEGDKFTYTGATGSNTAKDWAFVSADGTILTKSENIDHYTEVITAPNGAVKLIAQVNKVYFTDKYYLCKGIILKKNVSNTVYELSNVSDSLAYSKFVKILEGMFLDGNGGIATRRGSNTYVFKVSENSVISDMATGGTSMYYSFFGEEPVLGTASFDGQRLFADCSTIKGIKVPNGCKYIAVTNSENVITINPIGVIGDTKKLSTTNKSELVSAVNELNYSTARKPTITFMLDADYDRNKMIVDAFNEKGIKIGVALRLTMLFNYNTEEYYHDFVAKGNEILVHGNYKMGTNAEYSDDEINGFIRQAYTDLDALGFSPKGFVAYQGNCKPVFVPTIKRYFEWGATALNHSAEEESCLYFGNDNPFRLWRYSMQSSTLQQMKNAVDRCIDTNGLLFFYGHAQSSNIGNLTPQNVDALCTYILSKGIDVRVLTPTNAVKEYYAIRYDDIVK